MTMADWGAIALAAGFGYLLGSIPFGLVLTKLAGLGDIRAIGSGNIGATNVLRTGRKGLALVTLVLDGAKGAGAVFSFEIKGGTEGDKRQAGKKFIEALRVFSHLANVGDAKSLVIHPASTTHYRMSDADLKRAGITAGTVRLSIGLEDSQDLIEDLDRALRISQK